MNKKMNNKWILLMATALLMIVAVSSIAIFPVAAQSATRTLPSSVAAGGTVEVGIAAADYGMAGQVIETLPAGFDYVSSSLSESAVAQVGQGVTFTLFGETSFTYTVTASSTPGTHTFSGILKDFDKNEYVVGGNTGIVVGGVVPTATRTLPSPVAPGGTVEVGIAAADYGMAGQVIETLPAGFDYVSSSLSPTAVAQDGQEVTFTLFGEASFTYTVTASSTPGTYTFSGILKDFDKNEYVVGGDKNIVVTPPVVLTSITVSPSTKMLYVGYTQQFTATAKDQSGNVMAGIIIAWTSSDTTVGTIGATGLFTANAVGTTTITATNGSISGTASVTVSRRPSGGGRVSTISTTGYSGKSSDGKASVTIPKGTTANDAAGEALRRGDVSVISRTALPAAAPSGVSYVGYAYNFGPTGATFNPAIEISIEFDLTKFEGKTPVIYVYEAGAWKALETTVVGNKATAKVTHFSTFVLFAAAPTVEPTTAPTTAPTAIPTAAPTAAEPEQEPDDERPWGWIIGIIIAVIIVGAAAYYFYTKKKA